MSTDLSFDKTAIVSKGGQKWAYKRVQSDGSALTSPDTWHDGTYREKSDIEFKQPNKNIYDESGALVTTESENFDASVKIVSLQDDAALINFLKDEVGEAYFAIMLERGTIKGTKTQEMFFPIVRIERSYKSSAPSRRPEINITPLENATAITPTALPTWVKGVTGDFTVAINGYFSVKET